MPIPFKNDIQVLGLTITGNYTTAERTGLTIGAAEAGAIVFDTTIGEMFRWDGTAWNQLAAGTTVANLSLGTVSTTTVEVLIDTGTDVTLPAATNSTAGVATAAQITNLEALVALDGVPAGQSDLGTFTGTTISDANDIKGALQELETAHEAFVAQKGAANGLASLNGSGVIPNSQLPDLAISDVYVEATIASRDLLAASWGVDQEGDTVIVTDAGADPNVPSGESATYIWDGGAFVRLTDGGKVYSVNGADGVVVLVAGDIGATAGAVGTPTAGQTDVQGQLDALNTAVDSLQDADDVYTESFLIAGWAGPSGGAYTYTIAGATHGFTATDIMDVETFEDIAGNYRKVRTRVDINGTNDDVVLTVRATPDGRFPGYVSITQNH